jgi:hypothetical protein
MLQPGEAKSRRSEPSYQAMPFFVDRAHNPNLNSGGKFNSASNLQFCRDVIYVSADEANRM